MYCHIEFEKIAFLVPEKKNIKRTKATYMYCHIEFEKIAFLVPEKKKF